MKKLSIVLLLVLTLALLIACGDTVTTTVGTPEETTTAAPNTDATGNPNMVHGELIETENYVAVSNAVKFKSSMALTDYDVTCASGQFSTVVNTEFKGYKHTYVVVGADGSETTYNSAIDVVQVIKKAAPFCGIKAELNETAKTAKLKIYSLEDEFVLIPSWTSLTCKAGYYVMFEFMTNMEATYRVTVTTTPGGSRNSALYEQPNIHTTEVSGKKGQYTGTARCTIPYAEGKEYYINICLNSSPYTTIVTIPVTITAPKYDLPFQFIFSGDWDQIKDKSYIDNLYEVLYNSYPRAYKRWAYTGNEALVLQVVADANSESIAYNAGTKVCVQVGYANSSPDDVGLFAHEFTHAIQSGYGISYNKGWFTEAMADYGRFRFFHWGYNGRFAKIYSMDDPSIRDFHGDGSNNPNWHGYAQHNVFMAYLDWVWPTTDKNNDGEVTPDEYGLIDHIVYEAKMYKGSPVNDNPHTVGSTFNGWVKDITGIETMDLVREKFVKELDEGTFVFKGFRDYVDNFLVEGCWDIPDLTCPMYEKILPTGTTHPMLAAAVTTGDNLCKGAMIVMAGANPSGDDYKPYNMIDGKLETRYQGLLPKKMQTIMGVDNEIVIDLMAVKTFDTYTIDFYGSTSAQYAKEWEVLVSTDGHTYTAVDYQKNNDQKQVSVTFDEVSARYVKIYIYKTGATRINEFMLFDLNK